MEQAMNVHKCDGHGKVDFAFLKSMFRRVWSFSFPAERSGSAAAIRRPLEPVVC
jgi:hypothetical protein